MSVTRISSIILVIKIWVANFKESYQIPSIYKLFPPNSQGTKVFLWNKCFHTLYSLLIRSTYISRCSSPIPEIIVYKQILCIKNFTKIQIKIDMDDVTNLATLSIQTHTESRILLLEAIQSFRKLKVKRVFSLRTLG